MTLHALRPLMQAKGSVLTPEEFHREVNLAFHDAESSAYDELHRSMWQSLPAQFNLLVDDLSAAGGMPEKLVVLDVGSGTGLSSELLLRTGLGPRIERIDLLDTSPGMLGVATRRARQWSVPVRAHEGTIDSLPSGARYDLILTCSVLHHIPDLDSFLGEVDRLQEGGGAFLHLQDPDADNLASPRLARRKLLMRIAHRLARLGRRGGSEAGESEEYLKTVNRTLLDRAVVKEPLTAPELWSVTDIHVPGNPLSVVAVSLKNSIGNALPRYAEAARRSYGFFGQLADELPPPLRGHERKLVLEHATGGYFLAGAWVQDRG